MTSVISSTNWTSKLPYSNMWLATEGHRTVGQEKGLITGIDETSRVFNCTPIAEATAANVVERPVGECPVASVGCPCYGWTAHTKPTVRYDNKLIAALTAIVHMNDGHVTHIAWDSNCNLVQPFPSRGPPLAGVVPPPFPPNDGLRGSLLPTATR